MRIFLATTELLFCAEKVRDCLVEDSDKYAASEFGPFREVFDGELAGEGAGSGDDSAFEDVSNHGNR